MYDHPRLLYNTIFPYSSTQESVGECTFLPSVFPHLSPFVLLNPGSLRSCPSYGEPHVAYSTPPSPNLNLIFSFGLAGAGPEVSEPPHHPPPTLDFAQQLTGNLSATDPRRCRSRGRHIASLPAAATLHRPFAGPPPLRRSSRSAPARSAGS